MLFNLYDSFLFFLLFILPGPSMVSAELPPLLPKGLIRLPSIPKEHWLDATYLRVPVPGKTADPLHDPRDMIKFPEDQIVNFDIFNQPGGPDVYLTKRNRNRIFGRWRQLPKSSVSLRDRLSELVFWDEDGQIKWEMKYAEVKLPISQLSSSFRDGPPPHMSEFEGKTWYRAVKGLQSGRDTDVIKGPDGDGKSNMQLGQIDLNRPLYLNNELTMERLVGGWLLWPGSSGWDRSNDLLLVWIEHGQLQVHLTSVGYYIWAQNQLSDTNAH